MSTALSLLKQQLAEVLDVERPTSPGLPTGIAGLGAIFQSQGSFVAGLNEILLVGAFVAFAGAVLGIALVRTGDLVRMPQPDAA